APYPNVQRVIGTVEEQLPLLSPQPDVVVVDPPRAGLDASIIETVVASDVRRMVYVSCDPATLARDLRRFVDGGFTIGEVQPIDMFPHTQHIECITTLDRAE
ncbi:MAG: 23S rRNA (uracil(1939)-C(5))-methyltransferase RlmD, partial [Chloroflexi bacterium]|nr:23S rRNA (uracil(1939)-C(5))-methyltransferase RlmD [Chloroflexota bacterium]